MSKKYSEGDITWSSIEKYIPYKEVTWRTSKDGIPIYSFTDENGKTIEIEF